MQATDPNPLEERLQRLNDRQEITDLVTRLGLMLDEKRFDAARSILADDVSVQTPGGSALGSEAVVAQARRNHSVRTQHAITDVLIDLDGDRAEVRANLIVTFAPDRPGARLVVGDAEHQDSFFTLGEVYRFEAVRTADGWRLSRIGTDRLWSSRPLTGPPTVGQTDADAA
jgi:SnoaL-like protein